MRIEVHNRNIISHFLSSQACLIVLLSLSFLLVLFWPTHRAQAQVPACEQDGPDDNSYVVELCFSEPLKNETLSGDVTITLDIEIEGPSPSIEEVRFYLHKDESNTELIMIDDDYPYTFVLPSTSYPNGVYAISVEALIGEELVATEQKNLKVRFKNNDPQPKSPISLTAIAAVLLLSLSLLAFVVIRRKRAKQA